VARHVCPFWIGYFLINPLRKLVESPEKLLSAFVQEGMTVLEPGCGMGYFTLPLARLVGPLGRVVAVDLQPRMLRALERRAVRTGLRDRIELRLAGRENLGLGDLAGAVDFAAALYVVHEVPDQAAFFAEVHSTLRPGGRLLVVEPKGHVSAGAFDRTLAAARGAGFDIGDVLVRGGGRSALLVRS